MPESFLRLIVFSRASWSVFIRLKNSTCSNERSLTMNFW